jgi:hypothetical protein
MIQSNEWEMVIIADHCEGMEESNPELEKGIAFHKRLQGITMSLRDYRNIWNEYLKRDFPKKGK